MIKELYESINKILVGDAELRGLLGYKQKREVPIGKEGVAAAESEVNIRRGYQTEGTWKKLLVFYFQPDTAMAYFSPNFRQMDLVVSMFDRDDDLNLFDISERVVDLLDGKNIGVKEAVFSYACEYTGQIGTPSFDRELKSYRMAIRFLIIVRKEI